MLFRSISCDASETGIGIIVGDLWDHFSLRPDWRSTRGGHNIDTPEAIAVELSLLALFAEHPDIRNATIAIVSDNEGITDAWEARRSREPTVNACFLRVQLILAERACRLKLVCVESARNKDADWISRGRFPTDRPRWGRGGLQVAPIVLSSILHAHYAFLAPS